MKYFILEYRIIEGFENKSVECVTRRDLALIWKKQKERRKEEKKKKKKTEVTTSSSQLKMKS